MKALAEIIEAHGGLERWRSVEELALRISTGGLAFASKGRGKAIRDVEALVSTRTQRTVFSGYPGPGRRGVFEAGSVRIESNAGEVVREWSDPRATFRELRHLLRWDELDMLYFSGYALWTYLAVPFVLNEPGFAVRGPRPWTERGETWQRFAVTFPAEIHTHSREQVLYFDERGRLRRHDYTAELFGRWARAAHYCFRQKSAGGLVLSTRRRVHPRRRNNRPLRAVTLVWIDIDDLRATR